MCIAGYCLKYSFYVAASQCFEWTKWEPAAPTAEFIIVVSNVAASHCFEWTKRLCKEEDVGYVDLWDSVVGKEGMYARDGLHLSGKGAAVFAEGLSGAVASGLGKVRYLN